jgi:hypothetical protein
VQVAVSAVNVVCAVRATRSPPRDVLTMAAFPTVFSGELASTLTVTVEPFRVPLTVDNCGALLLLVELPEHASTSDAAEMIVRA